MITITAAGGIHVRTGSITTTTAAGVTRTVPGVDVHVDREVTVTLDAGDVGSIWRAITEPVPEPQPEPEPQPVPEPEPQPPAAPETALGVPSTPVPVTPDPSDRDTQGTKPAPAPADWLTQRRFRDPERQAAQEALAATKAAGRSRFQQAMLLARQPVPVPEPEPEPWQSATAAPCSPPPAWAADDWPLQEPPADQDWPAEDSGIDWDAMPAWAADDATQPGSPASPAPATRAGEAGDRLPPLI